MGGGVKKRKKQDPPDGPVMETSSSDDEDTTKKYQVYKVPGYTRKYPENTKKTEFIVFLSHADDKKTFTDKDRLSISHAIRKYCVTGILHLKSINKYKIGITFDLSNNANVFLQNKKMFEELGLKASIPASDTEVTGVITSVPTDLSNKMISSLIGSSRNIIQTTKGMKMDLNFNWTYLLGSIIVLNAISWTQAELFTAISEVEPLLETHKRIIDDLDDYIAKEEKRLITLKKHLSLYKREHEKAMEDIPNYLGNPINAFTLIKRLTTDLDFIESSIKIGTEYIKNITMNHDDVKYPALEDLTGAAQALTRLQETYHLDVHELSEGVLNGVVYSTPMTAGDCYELGRALYNEKDYKNALAWMTEALRKYREEKEPYHFSEIDVLEYISFSHYLLGDVRTALEWTKKLLVLDPKHPRAPGNIPHYQKTIAEEEARKLKRLRGELGDEPAEEKQTISEELSEYHKERKSYEILCRGEMDIPTEIAKRLHCRYLTENHPFLRLAPIKMEYMYLNPDVVIFHDVMSDDEIHFIQEAAKPRFKRAVVHDPKTGELVPAHYRISKSAWLRDEESEVIARVSQRVADMTGLSMDTAEDLQVVNYGIGGHYEPHYDFARRQENAFKKFSGNRIATVLFYMSDVAQGGATVFTKLGLSLFPIKGAAAFWLNLHPSGEGDLATRHAACPVLRGSKWVSNKWLHQGGQEFLKPCDLEYQDEGIVRKIPKPVPKTFR